MKIEKLTLPAASDRRAYDIADMIDIRYHPSVAHVRILDDLHAEVSTACLLYTSPSPRDA